MSYNRHQYRAAIDKEKLTDTGRIVCRVLSRRFIPVWNIRILPVWPPCRWRTISSDIWLKFAIYTTGRIVTLRSTVMSISFTALYVPTNEDKSLLGLHWRKTMLVKLNKAYSFRTSTEKNNADLRATNKGRWTVEYAWKPGLLGNTLRMCLICWPILM